MSAALSADQIAVVTPTKGRPRQLRCLLETLSAQSTPVGAVLIADGGGDQADLVAEFADRLPITWLECPTPGQIPQRNFAYEHLPDHTRVVINMDDDLHLEPDAIESLVRFWNDRQREPGGVGLNLTNFPAQSDGPFRRLFGMGTTPFGRIWRSGYNTPITGVSDDIASQWLIGGATGDVMCLRRIGSTICLRSGRFAKI